MEPVFYKEKKRRRARGSRRRNLRRARAGGIFLAAAVAIGSFLAAGGPAVRAWGKDTPVLFEEPAGYLRAVGDLDFSGVNPTPGDLDRDGYRWDAGTKTLKLKGAAIGGTVTLPDDEVTIEAEGSCSINQLEIAGGSPQKTRLIFSGTGELTIEQKINICGGHGNIFTVEKGARVTTCGGIAIGADGVVDSTVTVEGTLTAAGGFSEVGGVLFPDPAVSAGTVVVKAGGVLEVSGKEGVQLNGMTGSGFRSVFTVEKGGSFFADCTKFNIRVSSGAGSFPEGSGADRAFSIPENYLPADCEVGPPKDGVIDLIRSSTGDVYIGPLVIHETHSWPAGWNGKDELRHWRKCTFEGCDKTKDHEPHRYDDTGKCTACGAVLTVALAGAEGLVYNGKEQRPGVAVAVDNTALDDSHYDVVYRDNQNAGEASVTVTGKDGQTFVRTMIFPIARAVPVITWGSAAQELTYTGLPAGIVPPAVTLANGETYGGVFRYSYAAAGSGDSFPGRPVGAGVYTVRAGIAQQGNYTAAESADALTLTIRKAAAPILGKETRKYTYTKGSGGPVVIDVAGKLPADRGETTYTLAQTDEKGILSGVSVDENGILTFTVPGRQSAGDTASVTVTAEMANYENAVLSVEIRLVEKRIVEPQAGSRVTVKGSPVLTYGQTLSDLTLDSVVFVEQGTDTEVKGSLAWKDPETVPAVGTREAEWIFTPADPVKYEEQTGMADILVVKATPNVEAPAAGVVVYHPSGTLGGVELSGGKASWTVGGRAVTVAGTWSWKDPLIVPTVGSEGYAVVFTPEDTANYNTAESTTVVTVEPPSSGSGDRPETDPTEEETSESESTEAETSESETAEAETATGSRPQTGEPQNPWWILMATAAALAAGIGGCAVRRRKGRR